MPADGPAGTGPWRAPPAWRGADAAGALRQAVLAVSVLDDVDLVPAADGVELPGPRSVVLPWEVLAAAVAPHEPSSLVARSRLRTLLRLHRLAADLGDEAVATLADSARALALPADHVLHPGADWVREQVLGGAPDLGIGLHGVAGDPDDVVPLPPSVAGVLAERREGAPRSWWPRLREHAEHMGVLAAQRLSRESGQRQLVLRPVGGCDVPTLLVSPQLRRFLADGDGSGLRAVAVPMRSRGWYDLARIDPAFVAAAWTATDAEDRGLARPLLVTADEVGIAAPSGDPVAAALADPAAPDAVLPDVRYR